MQATRKQLDTAARRMRCEVERRFAASVVLTWGPWALVWSGDGEPHLSVPVAARALGGPEIDATFTRPVADVLAELGE